MKNMNNFRKIAIITISLLLLKVSASTAGEDIEKFLGRWALNFEEGIGWLEVRQEKGYLDADLLWRWGSVTPVADVYVEGDKLVVTRVSNAVFDLPEGQKRTQTITSLMVLQGKGKTLVGTMTIPNKDGNGAEVYYVTATKNPPLPPAPDLTKVNFGKSIDLLKNGMADWRLLEPNAANGWKVEKGELINNPVQKDGQPHINYGNLRTNGEFEDFNLKLKVNIPEGSNSGVYLRGIYEVQVMDSYGKNLDNHHMGALYSRITPNTSAEKKAGKWQDMDITLCERHLTVILNGKKIIDNQPVEGVTGGAMSTNESVPGPIYLQGDHGAVSYKDMVLTPIIR
jgi:hypothetical protein